MAKPGRKPKEYNADHARQVKAMAQYGIPYEDIAATVSMNADLLVKIYPKELAEGRAIANAKVGQKLFEKAMDGDVTALIFWAKCRMRWRTEDKKIDDKDDTVLPKSIKVQIINGRVNNGN